jgi:PAS domain-containing protein
MLLSLLTGMDKRIRVLSVGDSETAGAVEAALADHDEELAAESTTDHADALDRVRTGSVDCVVVAADGQVGVDLVAAVRDGAPDIPCLLYADAGAEQTVEDAFSAGATDYVRRSGAGQTAVLARRVHDHTDSDRNRQTLREHSRLLEQLFEQVPIYLYVKDREGRFRWVSEFYDNAPSDPIGKTDLDLFPQAGEKTYRDDMRVIETGDPLLNEEEYIPSTDHYNLTSKVPWYGRDGEIKGLIGVTREISELKESRRRLEHQNRRLEEFAGIVSHDLRNPLQVVRARLEMLDDGHDETHVAVAVDAADRMAEIITDTLTLARQGDAVGEFERVELGEVVGQCWDAIETESVQLELADPPVVSADRSRLRTLLENLLANAVEHTHGPTTVTVGGLPGGFYVADDGPGISADEHDAVFEVIHAEADEGTGFGLTIVAEVATAHGWDVAVTESESGGARFEVTGVETLEPTEPV